LSNCSWNLFSDNILYSKDANKSETSLLNSVQHIIFIHIIMSWATISLLQVFVGEANSSKGLSSILSNDLKKVRLHFVMKLNPLSVLIKVERATGEDDLGSTLHVDSLVVSMFSLAAILNKCRHSLSLGGEMEPSEISWQMLSSRLVQVNTKLNDHVKHRRLSSRGFSEST
jgi:hypothetical protein